MRYLGVIVSILFLIGPLSAEEAAVNKPSVQAMKAYEETYDVLMENVVNIKTPGYKAFDNIVSVDKAGQIVSNKVTRFTKGTLVETNNDLDVAIEGDGFFAVQGPRSVMYTRDGRFKMDEEYRLVTVAGNFPVLTSVGQLFITPYTGGGGDSNVLISPQGAIIQDKTILGSLLVVTFEDMSVLQRINGTFFHVPQQSRIFGTTLEDIRLKPGYIESSNVDLSRQLIELPLNSRKYDANSKALQVIRRSKQTAREMGRAQ